MKHKHSSSYAIFAVVLTSNCKQLVYNNLLLWIHAVVKVVTTTMTQVNQALYIYFVNLQPNVIFPKKKSYLTCLEGKLKYSDST